MSISDVIKNIFTFTNILSQAGTEIVRSWDKSSLRNAFNWARYCKKVDEETRDKVYRDDLDRYIQCLTIHLSSVCLIDLTIDRLQYAPSLLCHRLLQNPELPRDFSSHIYEIASESELVENRVVGLTRRYARSLSKFLVLDVPCDSGPVSPKELGQLILKSFNGLWKLQTDNKLHGFLKFVSKWTCSVHEENGGMELLGNVLLASIKTEEDHCAAESVKGKILKSLVSTSSPNRWVLSCNRGLLCQLCDCDDRFLRFYINQLVALASCLVPNYTHAPDGTLYTWQYLEKEDKDSVLSFDNLVSHVSRLLNYNRRLKSVFEPVLQERKDRTHFSVWKDLFKSMQDLTY